MALVTDRGVSITAGYAIALGITGLLVAGLLVAGGTFVRSERDAVAADEFRSIGAALASEIEAADRLARSTAPGGAVAVRASLPRSAGGSGYAIRVNESGGAGEIELTSGSTSVAVTFTTETPVRNATVRGGPVVVRSTGGGQLRVVPDG